jgi:hypothetical protein
MAFRNNKNMAGAYQGRCSIVDAGLRIIRLATDIFDRFFDQQRLRQECVALVLAPDRVGKVRSETADMIVTEGEGHGHFLNAGRIKHAHPCPENTSSVLIRH